MKKKLSGFTLLLISSITSSLFISCGNGNKTNNQAIETSTTTTDPDVVVINGIHWAKCNVDKPGTFAVAPEEFGMFYQWNNNVGWSTTNPIINSNGGTKYDYNCNSSTEDGYTITSWATANDPSPSGWRLPTVEEYRTLLDAEKVFSEWTTQNGVNGRKFTDKKTGQSIFFPAAGYREDRGVEFIPDKKKLHEVGSIGMYWSSNSNELGWVYYLGFYSNGKVVVKADGIYEHQGALSIRSVK